MILLLTRLKAFFLTVCGSELQKHIRHILQCGVGHTVVVVCLKKTPLKHSRAMQE